MIEPKVTLKFSFLQKIAEYYEFPTAVFLSDSDDFPRGKRSDVLNKKVEILDKIKDLVDEVYGE